MGACFMKIRGITLVEVIMATMVVTVGFFYFGKGNVIGRKQALGINETLLAQAYATELLEYFRSHKPERLKSYLEINPIKRESCPNCPITGCGTALCVSCSACPFGGYKFCSNINILDRTYFVPLTLATNTLNADPLAELPQPNPLDNQGPTGRANRWYQIQIVDVSATPLAPRKDLCAFNATEICLFKPPPNPCTGIPGPQRLNQYEKFLVTVGVSWIARSKTPGELKRVVLSTIIPDA